MYPWEKMKIKYRVRPVRLYTIIALIVLASIIFICFQLFSAQVLHLHNKAETKRSKAKLIDDELAKDDLLPVRDKDCKNRNGIGCISKVEEHINPKFEWVQAEEEIEQKVAKGLTATIKSDRRKGANEKDKVEMFEYPRGVSYDLRDQYRPDTRNMFTCLHSKTQIPYPQVNDDYCDCEDSSDEPGTSACPNSQFYCQFQFSWSDPEWYSSVRVNDGICDCCDGSDEWQSLRLPLHVQIQDKSNIYYVRQTPCEDQCGVKRAQAESRIKLREEGRRLQNKYIEAAKQVANPEELYGPSGIFYLLSLTCLEGHFDKYSYRVCPFRKVEQSDGPSTTVIGRYATWRVANEEKYELKMTGGDSQQCPEKKQRSSVIMFSCGLEDKVVSVHEFEVCEYIVEFNTPAAC